VLIDALVAEHAERQDRDVQVANGRHHLPDHLRVAVGVVRVENHRVHLRGPRGPQRLRCLRVRLGTPAGEHHRTGSLTDEAGGDGQPDVGTTAEHEDGLDVADGVAHGELLEGRAGSGG